MYRLAHQHWQHCRLQCGVVACFECGMSPNIVDSF
jgi:hypothetical protein